MSEEDGYLISEDTARLIARRIGGKDATPPAKPRSSFRSDGRITTFKNVSSETIPPYSVLMPVGVIEIDGTPVVEVDKYDGSYDGEFLFSWNFEVEYEEFGEIQKTRLVRAAYSGGTGEGSYAPESGEWALVEGSEYVQGLGVVPDADTDQLMGIVSSQLRTRIGKADSDITYDSYGTVSIWRNGEDTTEDIENVYLDWMHGDSNVSEGKEVLIQYFADEDKWRIIGAECEE